MKHCIHPKIVLTFLFVLLQVSPVGGIPVLQNPEVTPSLEALTSNPNSTSKVEPQEVTLRYKDSPLINVLKNIQEETGILFSIAPSLEAILITATIQADSWEDAVKQLLKPFSRTEVWTDNLETTRIWILAGSEINSEDFKQQIKSPGKNRMTQPGLKRQNPKQGSSTPLPKFVDSSKNHIENLPSHVLFDPGVLTFLVSKGIELPENVKSMFGPNLERLPENNPIPPHILNDLIFIKFLKAQGIQLP